MVRGRGWGKVIMWGDGVYRYISQLRETFDQGIHNK